MIKLDEMDLEALPNVDKRIVPQLRKYFSRIVNLDGKPLDYRMETIYNELMSGELEILVSSKDKNSLDYYEDMPKYAIGLFVNRPTAKEKAEGKITKEVSRIFIDEHQLDAEYIEKFSGYEDSTISHEMEHLISNRFDGQEHENDLCDYSIIGEAATEIGSLYNSFNGDEKEIKKVVMLRDDTILHIGYLGRVRLLLAINEAAGHSMVDLIEANRNNDFDYFCSIIPKEYIEKISSLYDNFFEGRYIAEIGEQPAKILYDAMEQFKDYMCDHFELYPNLTNQTINMIDSVFEGYEQMIECRKEVGEQLEERCILRIDYLEEEEIKDIITKLHVDFPEMSEEDIKYDIFAELLRQNPYNKKENAIMSCYSGYIKYLKSIEQVKEKIGQEDFIVRDNFEDFLNEYRYREGMPTRVGTFKQESIYREPETGQIKCFINGKEVAEDGFFSIILEEDDETYGECIELAGKVINEDEWKRISELILSKGFYKYIPATTALEQMKYFKEALQYYSWGEIEELTDEAREFLIPFYDNEAMLNEEEYELAEELNMADIARNAVMSKFSEFNFASYTSVKYADEEFKRRTELSKDEGERT